MRTIPFLQPGDTVAIVAPAKAIEAEHVQFARAFIEEKGFVVVISEHCLGTHHYFSGTPEQRLTDLQVAIDDPNIKAIVCARGGYGCVQLVDAIDWSGLERNPKWMIGFSDVTVFHQRLQNLGWPSIHGSMPLNFANNTPEALYTLITSITEPRYSIAIPAAKHNRTGQTTGTLVGGNLSIVYSLIGTNDQVDYERSILYIEEVGEHLYAIDRMFYALKKAGILDQLSGLIVGGMTGIKDTETPFGISLEALICAHFEGRDLPIAFDFPAGHIDDNRALRLGAPVKLMVTSDSVQLDFLA